MISGRILIPRLPIYAQYLTQRGATKLRNKWQPLDRKWRQEQGLPRNANAYGPLTNLPDYTFMDGRPTPLGSNQKKRLLKQREIAEKIVTMCRELDDAKKNYQEKQENAKRERQRILDEKLKPKGKLLMEGLKEKPLSSTE